MGRPRAPIADAASGKTLGGGRLPRACATLLATLTLAFAPAALTALLAIAAAQAQTLNDRLSRSARDNSGQQDRLLLDANEFVYDRDADTISARGDVQVYYQGRALQADRVIYDRRTKRVRAEGRAKLTERDGTVAYAERFELSDDFRDGFIDSLRAETADRTTFTAGRAERVGGDTTVFDDSSYTACEVCKDNPSKPPLWRVRAKRIIHKNDEQTIYYEDATLELWGMPIAWLPFFSSPDPTVTRKTGFLAPRYIAKSTLGGGVSTPFYWALSPQYDVTITPTILSRQGVLGTVEWRHRVLDGAYNVRASGIFQQDPDAFSLAPDGPGNKRFRGSLESAARFNINDKWSVGWDVTVLSDRWFIQDYKLPNQQLTTNYFKEAISTVFLTGKGDRGYFDLRGYHFQGLSRSDLQEQQPVVAPLLDYNKTFDVNPDKTFGLGGQIEIDFNFTNISRELASYEAIGGRRLDRAYQLYDVCDTYERGSCLIRGMGGNYARGTVNVSWKRKFIDPIGQVWTPFVFTHMNGAWLNVDTANSVTWSSSLNGCLAPCTSTLSNADQLHFFGDHQAFRADVTPGVGLEYRYPFLASTSIANHVFEPIVQVIARPNTVRDPAVVNEDAQSLVFDDTNLFAWSKYSGYDRFEGGTRANYGFQYTAQFHKGGYANVLVGQSYLLYGQNSYASADAANIGISSGLDTRRSDYVARAAYAPNSTFNFIAKGRFDAETFNMRRLDLVANANFGSVQASLQYARYSKQPEIGFDKRREGLAAAAKVKLTENVFVTGNLLLDMSRHLYTNANNDPVKRAPLFSVAGLGVGAGYTDECTTLAVNYTSILQDNGAGTQTRNQTVTLQLQLRTLGDTRVRSSLGDVVVPDGLSASTAR